MPTANALPTNAARSESGRAAMSRATATSVTWDHGRAGQAIIWSAGVEAQVNERVEARIAGLDPGDERVEDLDRGEIPPADAGREFVGGDVREFVREGHGPPLSRAPMPRFIVSRDAA